MASGTPSAQVRVPVGDLTSPPTSAHTILLGGKIIRRRKNYVAAEYLSSAGGPKNRKKISQCRKLSQSAENTVFHILIHCETIPYPDTFPKLLS